MTKEELLPLIFQRLRNGLLPPSQGTCKLYGGCAGDGEACDACGRPFRNGEAQYEVELFSRDGEDQRILLMHVACHSIWFRAKAEELRRAEQHFYLGQPPQNLR